MSDLPLITSRRADPASPVPETTGVSPVTSPRPDRLLLRTAGSCDFDPEHLLDVFCGQRQRFVSVLRTFGPDDWAAPTRCAEWSAHDVVRHLCDDNAIGIGAGANDRALDVAAGFDPRTTPRRWLAASAGEAPDATLSRFVATTGELILIARDRLVQNRRFDIHLPFGPMDWTVLMLHGFWDSWIHERDILLARGDEHPTGADAIAYAATYGLFLAAAVASMFGDPVQEKLTLGGEGGGIFDLNDQGALMLAVDRVASAGPPAAKVVDALVGRLPIAAVLNRVPAGSLAALSHLANLFNTPAD